MDYTVELIEDENGDLVFPFPAEVSEETGWKDGDVLEFKIEGEWIRIHNITKNK